MALTWSTLPLLPLRCILEHLSTEDALAAMSTCRHWRSAVNMYEGRKETLKLNAKHFEKNLYLTRMFRRHAQKVHIYLDCNEIDLEEFFDFVLPQFFDTEKLQELIFIGPIYTQQRRFVPFISLERVLTESLVFKHIHSLKKLAFMGCGMGDLMDEDEQYSAEQIETYARPLNLDFSNVYTPADVILSRSNQRLMQRSTLTQIITDYEQIITSSLETLSHLPNFRHLTLNIINTIPSFLPLNWDSINVTYKQPLQVAINIIAVPYLRFNEIMENILVEGVSLVSLKVMFCRSLYTPLLSHVSRLYQATLQELVWVDCPCDSNDAYHRIVRPMRQAQPSTYAHVNPFVLLCWQCVHLRRLVIHGYWVWQYDVLGFVRLRKTLSHLEVSAIYDRQDAFNGALKLSEEGAVRVLVFDSPATVDADFVNEVNKYTEFKWKPIIWNELHPALRGRWTPEQRAEYVVGEAIMPLGVTHLSRYQILIHIKMKLNSLNIPE